MRLDKISVITIIITLISCGIKDNKNSTINNQNQLLLLNQRFGFNIIENNTDTNNIMFSYLHNFDTSFVFNIWSDHFRNKYYAYYYEINPKYYRSINDFEDSTNKLLYFNGMSFQIDTKEVRKVKQMIKTFALNKNDSNKNEACADCGQFMVLYNRQFFLDRRYNSILSILKTYIKQNLIKPNYNILLR